MNNFMDEDKRDSTLIHILDTLNHCGCLVFKKRNAAIVDSNNVVGPSMANLRGNGKEKIKEKKKTKAHVVEAINLQQFNIAPRPTNTTVKWL